MAGRNYWETPWIFVQTCEREWGLIELDVCASESNRKGPVYYDEESDGLRGDWLTDDGYWSWMNPPYTSDKKAVVGDWVQKAIDEAARGARVMALLVNDPSTAWFRLAHAHAAELWTLLGPRIRFEIDGVAEQTGKQTHVLAVFRKLGHWEKRRGGYWDWRAGIKNGKGAA